MTVADARQFPWIAAAFESVLSPYLERFERYLSYLTSLGVLDCSHPILAAQQHLGLLNEPILWPRVLGQESAPLSPDVVAEEEGPDLDAEAVGEFAGLAAEFERGVGEFFVFLFGEDPDFALGVWFEHVGVRGQWSVVCYPRV